MTTVLNWDIIVDHAKLMLAKANDADWHAVAELEQQQKTLLQQFFSTQVSITADMIEQLLSMQQALLQLAEHNRQETGAQLEQLHHAQKALDAYSK